MCWKKFEPNIIGKVTHPFNETVPHGLKLNLGDTVIIKSKHEDWFYGYCILKSTPKSSLGIFPCTYVKVLGEEESSSQDLKRSSDCSVELLKSRLLNNMIIQTSIWLSLVTDLHRQNKVERFEETSTHINNFIELFYEITNWSVQKEKFMKFQNDIWTRINLINSLLNCDMVVRTKNFSILNVANIPLTYLEQLHSNDRDHLGNARTPLNVSINSMIKSEANSFTNLQIVIEGFEFFGCSDELVLQWSIMDIINEWNFEPFWQPIKDVRKGRPLWMGEKFVFKNIPGEVKKDGAYIVLIVYRIGQLLTDPNKQLIEKFRRPVAFGSYSLKDISFEMEKVSINLYNLSETDFLRPQKEILRMKLPAQTQNRFVQIMISANDQTINSGPDITDEGHILESIFLRTDIPYEGNRNYLYFNLESAEFDRANKSSARNVEAHICIKNFRGEKQQCIKLNPDTKNSTDYYTSVTYHCNSPRWKDLVKIDLNLINALDCHILIRFYHCTTKDKKGEERKHFGSCFLRLLDFFECGSSVKNCSLIIQKVSTTTKQEPKKYLHSNSLISTEQEKNSLKEFCKINLILCSTYLANNKEINDFLQYVYEEDMTALQLRKSLKNIQIISNEDFLKPKLRKNIMEIIRFYFNSDIALTDEMVETELFITWQTLSYKHIKFGLRDELLSNLKTKFDFIDGLLKGFHLVFRDALSSDISFDTLATVSGSMEPVFMTLTTYSDLVYHFQISERIKTILSCSLPYFNGYQNPKSNTDIRTLIFNYTIENLKYIQNLVSIDVLIEYFNYLFESPDFLNENILPKEKLDFIYNLLKLEFHLHCTDLLLIWFNPIIQICSKLINISSSHILKATNVLLILFSQLHLPSQEERIELISQKRIKTFFTSLYSVFNSKQLRDQQNNKYVHRQESEKATTRRKHQNTNENNLSNVSMESLKMYTLIFAYLDEWCLLDNNNIELSELFTVMTNMKTLMEFKIYPTQWLSMYLKVSNICACVLKKAAEYLQNKTEDTFNKLIPVFFEACYTFIMQSCLQLQNFPLAKSQKIMDEYGDMRINVMDYFHLVWTIKPSKVDTFDKSFTIQTTMRILSLSFLSVSGIRKKTVPLLIHIIRNWLDKCNSINEVLQDLISATELLLREGCGDESYSDSLNIVIQYGNMEDDVLTIIESFKNILNLHLDYRKVTAPSTNILHRQFALYSFMRFYQDEVRIFNHFQHYSNKLSEMLEDEEHYLEAALTLKPQYDYLVWSSEEAAFDAIFYENFEMGNEAQKKQLAMKILDLLSQTKEYEYSLELCKNLYKYYVKTYKYNELSQLMTEWANYYKLIMTEPRLTLNYYRVTFIGGILPNYMKRNRDYVVKGSIWFKINNLKSLLLDAFPDAEIQFYQSTPPIESPYEQKMAIYLTRLEPVAFDIDFIKNRHISTKIRNYYKDHNIITFTSDHPFHKGKIEKDNEIKTIHVCRVTVMVETMMPNMFMWSPIVNESRESLTPIEVAIDAVLKKNQIFKDTIDEFLENPSKDMRSFTMLLTGTLDAGVNGGMAKYIEAFFNENVDEEMDISIEHINCFREALILQKNVLSEALALHKKLAPSLIQPMHDRLEECFVILNKSVMDLNVFKKRSFSNMLTLSDVYLGTSQISFENTSLDQDYSFFQQSLKINENPLLYLNEGSGRNSDETISSTNTSNYFYSRSHSGSEKVFIRNMIGSGSSARKVSSTEEEALNRLACEYVASSAETFTQSIIPSISSPDIRSKFIPNFSFDDVKTCNKMSPPLPPNNQEPLTQTNKQKSRLTFMKWTLKGKSRQMSFSGNPGGTTKLSIDGKSKPKIADIFKNQDLN